MLRSLLLVLVPLMLALSGPAAAQSQAAEQEAMLSPAEKRAIQEALVWSGHYEARIDGVIGPATRSAIRRFQNDAGFTPTGYLRQRHVNRLLDARKQWTDRFGWEIRRFPELGLEVGIPTALFGSPESRENGLRFRSKDNQPRSELRLYTAPPMSDARFERLRDELVDRGHFSGEVYDAGDRDWFVFSGTSEAGIEQYTYLVHRQHGVRGFSLRYRKSDEEEMSRLNVAMYNSLETFPVKGQTAQPEADKPAKPKQPQASGDLLFTDRELTLLDGSGKADGDAEPQPWRQSAGFLVNADGAVLTTATAIEGCERIRVNRRSDASVAAVDRPNDLAVVKVPTGGRSFPHLTLRAQRVEKGDGVKALSYRGNRGTRLAVEEGKVAGLTGDDGDSRHFLVTIELRNGSRGAPLIDASGLVAGLAVGRPAEKWNEDQDVLPENRRLVARVPTLEAFLRTHGVGYEVGGESEQAKDDITAATRLATLRLECIR